MFLAYIYSNGDIGSDEYFEAHKDFIDYELRLEFIDECLQRLLYEKDYLKGLINDDATL